MAARLARAAAAVLSFAITATSGASTMESVPTVFEVCSNETFSFPNLLGAEVRSITANRAEGIKIAAGTPEGRMISADGLSVCNVTVRYDHSGQNDTTTVQVWLPLKGWNGRFVGGGGGGFVAGTINGEQLGSLVNLGYAAAITDAGHDWTNWRSASWALKNPGNYNYPLLFNFAYLSVHDLSVIGKAITAQYYGQTPKYSYFAGCSTGGRQGVTSAQRYPEDYDGIVAGAPALNLPDLTVSTYWPQSVMDRVGVYPTRCELEAINAFAVEACDRLDGVEDGVIADPDACDFDPQTVVGRTVQCTEGFNLKISAEAAGIVNAVRDGPRGVGGDPLFVGVPHPTPFTGYLAQGNTACALNGTCTGVPFPMSIDWLKLLTRRDPTYDLSKMTLPELERNYELSGQQLDGVIGANDPDLSRFRAAGRKMISWHGLADECITMRSTRNYYARVLKRDPQVAEYYRHFEAPGVNHCGGAAGSFYPLRALDALVRWVEDGITPDVLVGYKLPNTTLIDRDVEPEGQRPLCPYPKVLKYNGGDVASWGSYSCGPKSDKSAETARRRDEVYLSGLV